MRDILIKLFNTCVALPQILLETIITYKNNHTQEKLKKHNTLNNVRYEKRGKQEKKMRREKALPFF